MYLENLTFDRIPYKFLQSADNYFKPLLCLKYMLRHTEKFKVS